MPCGCYQLRAELIRNVDIGFYLVYIPPDGSETLTSAELPIHKHSDDFIAGRITHTMAETWIASLQERTTLFRNIFGRDLKDCQARYPKQHDTFWLDFLREAHDLYTVGVVQQT
jgi:hypothetical protein